MPTTTTPTTETVDIRAIVAAMGEGVERTATVSRDALTDMLDIRVAMRDALLPAYNDYYDAELQAAMAKNPGRDPAKFTVGADKVNAYLSGLAKGAKLRWSYNNATITELLYTLDGHSEANVTKYLFWCVDGQGKTASGDDRPPVIPSYPGYLAWLPTRENYTPSGKETAEAKRARLLAEQTRALNAERQVGTVNYVTDFMPGESLRKRVEGLMRQAHDINRALIIIERGLETDEERKDFRDARRAVNKAIKGE